MIDHLVEVAQAIKNIDSPWLLTAAGVIVLLVGIRTGFLQTSLPRIEQPDTNSDYWLIMRWVTRQAITNSIFFGIIAFLAVMWDKWWLTVPLAMLLVPVWLLTLLQTLVVVGASIPMVALRPQRALPIIATTLIRISGDAVELLFTGLVVTALLT